jgi:NitT/TauT family transport system substrate-binding protein
MHCRSKVHSRNRKRSPPLTIFFLTLIALGLGFEPGQTQTVKKTGPAGKITIADGSSINSALLYVALKNDYFRQEGLEVACRLFPSGKAALDAVLGGKGDLATVADIPIMFAVMEGARISVMATISEALREISLIGRKDQGILSKRDLKGKRIGVTPKTVSEYFLDVFLIFNRIPRDQIKVIPLLPDQISGALLKGEIDGAVTWNPHIARLQDQLGANGYIDDGRNLYHMVWNLAGPEDFVKGNPEVVKKILRALIRGKDFVKERPAEAQKIVAGFLGLTEAQVARAWNEYAFQVTLPPLLLMNLENQARWAIRKKSVPQRGVPNFLPHFYFEGLKAVDPEAVTIVY